MFLLFDLEFGDYVVIKKDLYEYYVIIIFKIVGDIFEVVEVSNLKSGGMIVVLSFCLKVIILIYDKKFNFDK